jgi:hypothetical protein
MSIPDIDIRSRCLNRAEGGKVQNPHFTVALTPHGRATARQP